MLIYGTEENVMVIFAQNNMNRTSKYQPFLDCYLIENGTQISKRTETFDHFETLYKKFQDCLGNKQEDLCPSCMNDYLTLSEYYTKISDVNEKISFCIDIVDIVSN